MNRLQHQRRVSTVIVALAAQFVCTASFLPRCMAEGGVRVNVTAPEKRTIVHNVRLPGSLEADERVDLYAKASGYVKKVDVLIGDAVKANQVLVLLDIPEMADEIRRAEAIVAAKNASVTAFDSKVTQAERAIDSSNAEVLRYASQHHLAKLNQTRRQELRKGSAISQQALDEADSAVAVAEAELNIAKTKVASAAADLLATKADREVAVAEEAVADSQLGRLKTLMTYAEIKAPFDGVITRRKVDHGTFVRSAAEGTSMPLLEIMKVDRIRIVADVPEAEAVYVSRGTEVQVNVSVMGEPPFPLTVSRTSGAVDPRTRTVRIEIDMDNKDRRLTPGMFAELTFKLATRPNALVIPSKALSSSGSKMFVFVNDNGKAARVEVGVGYDDGIEAEVVSGLKGSEQVIVSSSGTVRAGTTVTIAESGL
ncbi:MAG: efflux RND transporter periplasmic adaptor subunit [Planctomycetes bacterium]|nr:efflux RND transporter periplasmic adaptor subunit [Planctomycetota bacterium]